ncbi:helix-turn-helix domain-containing protein [Parvularcula oceani]|uniref:helix-turn-helix domain-containing protein n=1 Tax=Parvularcula oceani TaxID=1247963 RepID=UPI0006914762|nr:helix-turn-helix domain-containing protein [Parvularcula oceani]
MAEKDKTDKPAVKVADTDDNVVAFPKPKASRASERKWSKPVMDIGFCIVPSLLLRAQGRLGLNPTQLAVLLQLCDFWWDEARKPYPSKDTLSERLGISPRQIQRYIAELEDAGLVKRIERHHAGHGGKLSNMYDLSGLVERLKVLAPEFRQADEEAREARKAVIRKAHRRRPKNVSTN